MEGGEMQSRVSAQRDDLRKRSGFDSLVEFRNGHLRKFLHFVWVREDYRAEQRGRFLVEGKLDKSILPHGVSEGKAEREEDVVAEKVVLAVAPDELVFKSCLVKGRIIAQDIFFGREGGEDGTVQ